MLLVACGGGKSDLERAAEVLADDARFVTSAAAGEAFNEAAALVLADARDCAEDRSGDDPRCVARFQAAAYLQAESVEVTACDRDGRREARATARRALQLRDLPQLVRC